MLFTSDLTRVGNGGIVFKYWRRFSYKYHGMHIGEEDLEKANTWNIF